MSSPASADRLQEALENGLRGRSIAGIRRFPSAYRTSFPIEDVKVTFKDGSSVDLVLKRLGRDGLDERARRAKPEFLHDPVRELEAYRALESKGLGSPDVVAYGEDWILLEKVPGVELYQVGELETWRAAARWLARLHALFADQHPPSPHLLRYDAGFYRLWPRRALEHGVREVEPIAARYEEVVECLQGLPSTFIHGEFYASNVLVVDGGRRVAPVDWEMAGVGPGLIDLAALTTGGWRAEEQEAIAAAYGPHDAGALDCCRLHLALQWLGWSGDWEPPAEHAHDWLGEAVRAAERLGLL